MAARKERVCDNCGEISFVFGKATTCLKCQKKLKQQSDASEEIKQILEWNYTLVSGPVYNNHGKRTYVITNNHCNHQYEVVFGNLRTGVDNAKAKNLPMPCGTCGPKHRLANALSAYIEKYGRDYDISKWQDYMKLVRKLSDITYRQFKEEINPENHRRGKKTWHLDHKHPIIACFKDGWAVEKAASRENLQMLTWQDNLVKSGKSIA